VKAAAEVEHRQTRGGALQLLFGLWGVTTPYPVLLAFAISNFGTGLVFGIYPAYRASRLDPVEAMRRE